MNKTLFRECMNGKSLLRTLQNLEFSNIELYGKTIDLGSKNGNASYYRFFNIKSAEMTYVDNYYESKDVINLDLESTIPLNDNHYNNVLSINLFEHIFNIQNLINEIYRILDVDGKLIGSTPFHKEYHADPNDFYRFTQDFYERAFSMAGFKNIKIVPVGIGIFHQVADSLSKIIKFRILRCLIWFLFIKLDMVLSRFYKNNLNFYSSLVFYCEK